MKKLLTALLATAVLFTACSEKTTDDELVAATALEFCTALSTLDFEALEMLKNPGQADPFNFADAGLDDPVQQAALQLYTPFTSSAQVEIIATEINGDMATVTLSITYTDISEHTNIIAQNAQITAELGVLELDDPTDLTSDAYMQLLADAYRFEAEKDIYPTKTTECTIMLTLVEDVWYISSVENATLHALLAGISL